MTIEEKVNEGLIQKPNICPICGNNNLFYSKSREDGDDGFIRLWTCEDCGAEGIEVYTFVGHYNVNIPNKQED